MHNHQPLRVRLKEQEVIVNEGELPPNHHQLIVWEWEAVKGHSDKASCDSKLLVSWTRWLAAARHKGQLVIHAKTPTTVMSKGAYEPKVDLCQERSALGSEYPPKGKNVQGRRTLALEEGHQSTLYVPWTKGVPDSHLKENHSWDYYSRKENSVRIPVTAWGGGKDMLYIISVD